MTWTAPDVPLPDVPLTGDERPILEGFLAWHRALLRHKCAGLTGAQLAECAVPPSNLSLLGLVRHLAKVERTWFRRRFRSEDVPMLYVTAERPDADFEDLDPAQAEAEYAALLAEQEQSRRAVDGVPLDASFDYSDGEKMSLRMVLLHMTTEYARHNGHADLLRERIDGETGD